MQTTFTIETHGPGLVEISGDVGRWLVCAGAVDGLLTLLIQHTSASLLIGENADGDVRSDLLAFLRRVAPHTDDPSMGWVRHRSEGPDDMPAHLKAAMLPVSLSIPVQAGRLVLGTWQGIFVVEHRDRPHRRHVAAHFRPD